MAKIILAPHEEFEHYHSDISFTKLLSGQAVFQDNTRKIFLKIGESIKSFANKSHTIKNIGNSECTLSCWHGGDGGGGGSGK